MVESADTVDLTVPKGACATPAMRMVVGWVASCNHLGLDVIDDLDLALETLMDGEPEDGAPLTLHVAIEDRSVRLLLRGLENRALHANLSAHSSFVGSPAWPLDVRIFLKALVDLYRLVDCGSEAFGVELWKRFD